MSPVRTIIVVALVVAGAVLSLYALPVLGFRYSAWRLQQALNTFPESEILERSNNLPEVKAFLEKYPRSQAVVIPDFHLDVWYIHPANATANERATLEVGINLDTGYPQGFHFWCDDKYVGRFPLDSQALMQAIKDC
jgi:hypothetical protein